jgi:hypothetical protein
MSLKFAVEQNQGYPVEMSSGPLTEKLSQYASLLASQGALVAASTYLVRAFLSYKKLQSCSLAGFDLSTHNSNLPGGRRKRYH